MSRVCSLAGIKIVIALLAAMSFVGPVNAQDPQFTQFYANPLYLNPALAGTGECSRIMVNYRNQWPGIAQGFTTYNLAVDHYSSALSGGVGLLIMNDNASGVINTLHASGVYAFHLNLTRDMQLNAGFEVSYHQQRLNWEELIFSDMIDRVSGVVDPSATVEQPPANNSLDVADFSAGLLLGIRKKFFVGLASHHLTQPDLSYYSNNVESPLYRKYTLHAGGQFVLIKGGYRSSGDKMVIQPGVLMQMQQDARQVTGGFNVDYIPLTLGIWYRHNFSNPDGVIFLAGLRYNRIKFGYAYDLTLSKLSDGSGGAHEVSLAFQFACNKKRNRPGALECPEF